jgi:hypothetical protein
MPSRRALRLSGRSEVVRLVLRAAMPQPMSTPTAAGAMASFMAMTEPTVAPFPKWTSGMTATCLNTQVPSWTAFCPEKILHDGQKDGRLSMQHEVGGVRQNA